ncbi:MAG: CrcB family protein, partial [Propionibacteriaceae bacterium]|nr:CrcB family protein [Propionibacteriaceae bacterium]
MGGFAGTLVRALLQAAVPPGGWPWATFAVNLVGAFALGAVSEYVIASHVSQARRASVRLAVGVGLLGSFTTYSSLAHEAVAAGPVSGLGYGLVSVDGGMLFAGAGIA